MTIAVGDRPPEFTLPDADGKPVSLRDLEGKGPIVVFFYPKDDSPGCTIEVCSFRDRFDAFVQAGAAVVGISSDPPDSHGRFAQKHGLPMTLLSDVGGKVRAAWGVKATLGLLPGRATFVLDKGGIVRHVFVSQLRAGAHVGESLAVVKQLAPG